VRFLHGDLVIEIILEEGRIAHVLLIHAEGDALALDLGVVLANREDLICVLMRQIGVIGKHVFEDGSSSGRRVLRSVEVGVPEIERILDIKGYWKTPLVIPLRTDSLRSFLYLKISESFVPWSNSLGSSMIYNHKYFRFKSN